MIFNAYVSCLQAEKMPRGEKRELQTAIINKAIDRLPSGKLKITEEMMGIQWLELLAWSPLAVLKHGWKIHICCLLVFMHPKHWVMM